MIQIRLLKDWQSKKAGDLINISEKGAKQFIKVGAAEYVKENNKGLVKIKFLKDLNDGTKKGTITKTKEEVAILWEKEGVVEIIDKPKTDEEIFTGHILANKVPEVEKVAKIPPSESEEMNETEFFEILRSEDGLIRYHKKIVKILKEWIDMDEQYYNLVSLWIIGTYFHKQFPAYPYLFFNAMKGSGKTRMLKIISNLAFNGKVAGSMTEAVLFRTASKRSLCIDEFENINAKGMENFKLLLNSAYKRGTTIERMTKKKTPEGESQVVEEFEVYCPIALANIQGMDNILGDRCLSIILEKSSKIKITNLIEDFENDIEFQKIRGGLKRITGGGQGFLKTFSHLFRDWNSYIKKDVKDGYVGNDGIDVKEGNNKNNANLHNIHNLTNLFLKLSKTNINGRDLELFFPLFIISDMCSDDILENLIKCSTKIVKEKRESDRENNKDVKLYEFLSQSNYEGIFINTEKVANDFAEFIEEDPKYNTARSIGMAMSRLNLIIGRRREGKKRQVKINVMKAQEKLLLFKEPEKINFEESGILDE